MRGEILVGAAHVGALRVGQQEGVGRRRGAGTDADGVIIVIIAGIKIFEPEAEVARELGFGAAAGRPAPGVGLAPVGQAVAVEAVRPVAGDEILLDAAIGGAEGAIEEQPAFGIAQPRARAETIFKLAGEGVEGRGGAVGRHAVARIAGAAVEHDAIDDVAVLHVIADAREILDAVLVAAAAFAGGATVGGAAAKAGRESIGARAGAHRVAIDVVEIGIEGDLFAAIIALRADADRGADIAALPHFFRFLGEARSGERADGNGCEAQNGEIFHGYIPFMSKIDNEATRRNASRMTSREKEISSVI